MPSNQLEIVRFPDDPDDAKAQDLAGPVGGLLHDLLARFGSRVERVSKRTISPEWTRTERCHPRGRSDWTHQGVVDPDGSRYNGDRYCCRRQRTFGATSTTSYAWPF